MNAALIRGVQLKYQTPPPPPRGVRTVLGRGHDSGWGSLLSHVALVPSQPGTAVALVGGVTSLSLHPLDKGWGAQRGVGDIPSALTAAKNTPPRQWQIRGHSGRPEGTQPDSHPEPPRQREPRPR